MDLQAVEANATGLDPEAVHLFKRLYPDTLLLVMLWVEMQTYHWKVSMSSGLTLPISPAYCRRLGAIDLEALDRVITLFYDRSQYSSRGRRLIRVSDSRYCITGGVGRGC